MDFEQRPTKPQILILFARHAMHQHIFHMQAYITSVFRTCHKLAAPPLAWEPAAGALRTPLHTMFFFHPQITDMLKKTKPLIFLL